MPLGSERVAREVHLSTPVGTPAFSLGTVASTATLDAGTGALDGRETIASMSAERPTGTIAELLDAARARLERLEPAAARDAMAAGAVIVDTRCAEARRASGVIAGSVHVPLSVLFWRLDSTSGRHDASLSDRTRQVIVVCADGYSSSLAAATLLDLGFARATDMVGGFNGWVAAGLPFERAPDTTST